MYTQTFLTQKYEQKKKNITIDSVQTRCTVASIPCLLGLPGVPVAAGGVVVGPDQVGAHLQRPPVPLLLHVDNCSLRQRQGH